MRWLTYVTLATAIGSVTAHYYLRAGSALGAARASERMLATWGHASCVALIFLAAARAWGQWRTLGVDSADPFADIVRPMLFQTFWGAGLIGQVLLSVVGAAAFRAVPHRRAWWSATAAIVLLCVTPALGGHAVGGARPLIGVVVDWLHVMAGGVWLGTLTLLVVIAVPRLRDAAARSALHDVLVRFSRLALVSAAVLTLTGVYAAWTNIGSWRALWSTPYGDALVLKLFVVGVAGALGAINWRVSVPRLTLGKAQRFAASGTAEAVTALVIYLLSAVLVGRPLPLE